MSELPAEAHALFRALPDGFVEARDALVAELKAAGRDEDAAAVKRLRRPSVVTWTLNALAGADAEAVEALLGSGAELRAAQQAALSSERHADRLREATTARRMAVAELRRAAARVLADAGRSPDPYLDEIAAALEAASVEPDAAERLRSGTFERPPEAPAGFGDVFGLTSVPTATTPERGRTERAPAPDRSAALRGEVAKLRRDARSAASRAAKAREAADRASRQLEDMQARLERLRAKQAEAQSAAEAAELDRRRVERALDEATAQLEAPE